VRCDTPEPPRTAGADLAERPPPVSPAPYGSSMCSTSGEAPAADAVGRLSAAIEELAQAAREAGAPSPELAARLARAWDLVAELDPELARRLARYGD
jgi:hypothetical protein